MGVESLKRRLQAWLSSLAVHENHQEMESANTQAPAPEDDSAGGGAGGVPGDAHRNQGRDPLSEAGKAQGERSLPGDGARPGAGQFHCYKRAASYHIGTTSLQNTSNSYPAPPRSTIPSPIRHLYSDLSWLAQSTRRKPPGTQLQSPGPKVEVQLKRKGRQTVRGFRSRGDKPGSGVIYYRGKKPLAEEKREGLTQP